MRSQGEAENWGFSSGLSGRDKTILPRNIPVGTTAGGLCVCNFFFCFRLSKPVLSGADPEEGREWPFPRPLRAVGEGPRPARPSPPASSPGTFCFPLLLIWRIRKGQDLIPFSGSFFVFSFYFLAAPNKNKSSWIIKTTLRHQEHLLQ